MPPFRVIGHRGVSAHAPENTLASFDLAVQKGVSAVELDVHLSADGVPVVIHDYTVDRTTDGSGAVASLTLAELKALDAGSWFHPRFAGERIPTLGEVLERYRGKFHLQIELKSSEPHLPRRVADLLDAHGWRDFTVSSFHRINLMRMRLVRPAYRLCRLVRAWNPRTLDSVRSNGIGAVSVNAERTGPALVREARARGLGVFAWAVTTRDLLLRVARSGADGCTVDWPEEARELLTAWGIAVL